MWTGDWASGYHRRGKVSIREPRIWTKFLIVIRTKIPEYLNFWLKHCLDDIGERIEMLTVERQLDGQMI